ncbi:MAG: SRPBCC domain-containing protein [Bacteroidota bacterium]
MKMLKYSWRGGDGDDVKLDSVVTWTLIAQKGGTELTLVHAGFEGLRNYLPLEALMDKNHSNNRPF